jgi:polygalacturonase
MQGSNSKIVGRGIIDGSHLANWVKTDAKAVLPIEAVGRSNLEISGITIFDPNAWAIQLQRSSNITIDNLKILSSRCNSDGISIQSTSEVTITNSFLRTWDDSVVIKNYNKAGDGSAINSHDITVKNCIFWTDLAQTMELGVETNKGAGTEPKIYNVVFQDILIFHALHKAPISIHNGDNAEIYDVTFKNITVENYQSGNGDGWNYIIDITNLTGSGMGGAAAWTTVADRSSIHDILIENINILSGKNPTARFNSREGGSIHDVIVKDVYRAGTKVNLSSYVNQDGNTTITFE